MDCNYNFLTMCGVCLDDVTDRHHSVKLHCCRQYIHLDCLLQSLNESDLCIYCRNPMNVRKYLNKQKDIYHHTDLYYPGLIRPDIIIPPTNDTPRWRLVLVVGSFCVSGLSLIYSIGKILLR
jgi:hypothetical protein